MTFEDVLKEQPKNLQQLANELRTLILKTDNRIDENIHGGAKVKMALYSINETNNVLYGIGTGKDHIKLYLHHTDKPNVDVAGLILQGKGKHAKTVWLTEIDAAIKKQISTALKSVLKVSGY